MLKFGLRSIDDDDEELGEYGDQGLKLRAVGGRRLNSLHAPNHLHLAHFKALHKFYLCSAAGPATRLELCGRERGPCTGKAS